MAVQQNFLTGLEHRCSRGIRARPQYRAAVVIQHFLDHRAIVGIRLIEKGQYRESCDQRAHTPSPARPGEIRTLKEGNQRLLNVSSDPVTAVILTDDHPCSPTVYRA
jgi:hypothetical protein